MRPVVFHGVLGHTEEMSDLIHFEPRKETVLDDFYLTPVEPRELFVRPVQAQKLVEVQVGIF